MLIRQSRIPVVRMLTEGMLPSALKVALYRRRGAKIGRDVAIGPMSVVIGDSVAIGDGSRIGFATIVRGRTVSIGRHVKIGSTTFLDVEKITIDDDAKINEQVFAGGPTLPESHLHVGKRCIVMQHTFLNPTKPLIIDDDAGVGGKCSIFTHGSWQNVLDGYPVKFAPVRIGRNVWIPWNVFVMPGVTIGDNATIGAGSLVTKDVPPGSLAAGVPAKVMRTADEYPTRPDQSTRDRTTDEVLDEFLRYLDYFGWRTARQRAADGGEQIRVSSEQEGEGGRMVVLRASGAGSADSVGGAEAQRLQNELGGQDVVLSYRALTGSLLEQVRSSGATWIDLETKRRSDYGTPLGEELIMFLSRYGIRFDRA